MTRDRMTEHKSMLRLLAAAAATLLVVAALIAQRDVIVKLRTENEKMHTALYRIAVQGPFADDPWTIARNALEGKP